MPSKTADAEIDVAQQGVLLTDLLAGDGDRVRRTLRGAARETEVGLDGSQRQLVVDALIRVVAGAYAHLPLKRAGYASDPVQALVLLRRRCVEMSEAAFHLALTGLITDLRDAHTRYRGPSTLRGRVAALPFLVETYGDDDDPSYIVSKVGGNADIDDASFKEGVHLEWWNGMPMHRAVELHADRESAGRTDSRRARALESLTFRALDYGPPPDEHWVVLGYRTARNASREVRIPWRVLEPGAADASVRPASTSALHVAADPARQAVRQAKTLLFAKDAWSAGRKPAAEQAEPFLDVVTARTVSTRSGELGYLRLWSFDVGDDDQYLAHVGDLLGALPDRGLIVDLRGNPGGLVWAAERLLQYFTDAEVTPTRFSLLATPLTREMASSPFNRLELGRWAASLDAAVSTGELYSRPLPLTDPAWCNDLGRRYFGPVVAVVDANTYSAGDLFAAGFVDHGIGPLVAVGEATGGGGANVWTDDQVLDALAPTSAALEPLPAGAGFTLSIRRAVRSAAGEGTPIEDAGIAGIRYAMTRDDVRYGNRDLLEFCAAQLELG